MRIKWPLVLYLTVLAGFFGLFRWAYNPTYDGPPQASSQPISTTLEGRYATYTYTVSEIAGKKEWAANFQPALVADDGVLVGALHEIMNKVYGDQLASMVEPMVEPADDRNYVTFTVGNAKTFFEIFKNTKGEVGSVRFWREAVNQ